jgi:hypothetical protein
MAREKIYYGDNELVRVDVRIHKRQKEKLDQNRKKTEKTQDQQIREALDLYFPEDK